MWFRVEKYEIYFGEITKCKISYIFSENKFPFNLWKGISENKFPFNLWFRVEKCEIYFGEITKCKISYNWNL